MSLDKYLPASATVLAGGLAVFGAQDAHANGIPLPNGCETQGATTVCKVESNQDVGRIGRLLVGNNGQNVRIVIPDSVPSEIRNQLEALISKYPGAQEQDCEATVKILPPAKISAIKVKVRCPQNQNSSGVNYVFNNTGSGDKSVVIGSDKEEAHTTDTAAKVTPINPPVASTPDKNKAPYSPASRPAAAETPTKSQRSGVLTSKPKPEETGQRQCEREKAGLQSTIDRIGPNLDAAHETIDGLKDQLQLCTTDAGLTGDELRKAKTTINQQKSELDNLKNSAFHALTNAANAVREKAKDYMELILAALAGLVLLSVIYAAIRSRKKEKEARFAQVRDNPSTPQDHLIRALYFKSQQGRSANVTLSTATKFKNMSEPELITAIKAAGNFGVKVSRADKKKLLDLKRTNATPTKWKDFLNSI